MKGLKIFRFNSLPAQFNCALFFFIIINLKFVYYLIVLTVLMLNLMAVTLCVGMQPQTLQRCEVKRAGLVKKTLERLGLHSERRTWER